MKAIAFAVIVAAVSAGFASAQTKTKAAPTKYYVTVDGQIASLGSTLLEATLTFSQNVQVPGATLQAGTYLFTLVSPTTMRVTSEDRLKVYTTFATMSASRLLATSHAQVRFQHMPDGATRLIALYPNDASAGYAPFYKKTHREPNEPIATSGTKQ